MKNILVEVITPSNAAYKGEAVSVTVPGTNGNFQVLYNHAPIISSLEIGIVKIKVTENDEKMFSVSGGTVEVLNNKILILAESFESPEEIDLERAKESLQRAKDRLAGHDKNVDSARAEAALKRAINRIKFTEKYL